MESIEKLLDVMAALRDPDTGCPWDQQQDFASIAPYTIEEAYEVADAIDVATWTSSVMSWATCCCRWFITARWPASSGPSIWSRGRRHHGQNDYADIRMCLPRHRRPTRRRRARPGKSHKQAERAASGSHGALDDVRAWHCLPCCVPKLGKRAARVGFDCADAQAARAKIIEELAELDEASRRAEDPQAVAEEMGDLLFAVTNLARKLDVDPEEALRTANRKFSHRLPIR